MIKSPTVIVLAGRENTRPRKGTPLALWNVLGTTTAGLVLEAVRAVGPGKIFAVPEKPGDDLGRWFRNAGIETFSSIGRALGSRAGGDVLMIEARLPLILGSTLRKLVAHHQKTGNSATALCPPGIDGPIFPADFACPAAVFKASVLRKSLVRLKVRGRSRPSVGGFIVRQPGEGTCGLFHAQRLEELFEVDSPQDLAVAASMLRLRKIRDLAIGGVAVLDPASTWIDLDVRIGRETVISPSVIIQGKSRIGGRCRIYPNVRIADSKIGDGAVIHDFTVVENAVLEKGAQAGPFSRLRPGTRIRAGARVGNFVELKNTDFGPGSKALHLSYLGDSRVGEGVNIGAGTITCNYDGVRKNRTIIEDGVFIGSGTELVAPVRVRRKAYVAAGSTITKDVGPGSLAIARARQSERPGWVKKREAKIAREAGKRRRQP
jgi:bifunctional UDP-N-acetylglucosamine pyrophosphorylase / glucosamine-1-phosphate N-acetyltransferase